MDPEWFGSLIGLASISALTCVMLAGVALDGSNGGKVGNGPDFGLADAWDF